MQPLAAARRPAICRRLTGNEVPITPVAETRQGDVPIYLSDCARLFELDEWRPRRSAEQVLADIHEWVASDEERIAAALEIETPAGGRSSTVPVAIITGAGGLIGSEAVDHFIGQGFDVVGIENDMRARFFGPESSTSHVTQRLVDEHDDFKWENVDIRDAAEIERIFREHAGSIELVIHTAAQPSHDWAASEPQTDFGVNANGTLNLLEAARAHAIDAPFIFTSTNKVYGDTPNRLPLLSLEKRLELPEDHPYYKGIDTSDVDRRLDPLAVRGLEGGRRPAGAGVRLLLRHADRLLPRRLPDRPAARRREAARLPRLPDEVHRHRHALHRSSATRANRSATTSTAPT